MNDTVPTLEDLEQHEIAAGILLGVLTLALDKPAALDRPMAAALLVVAAGERDRQGDYGAAHLLDEWAETIEQPERN